MHFLNGFRSWETFKGKSLEFSAVLEKSKEVSKVNTKQLPTLILLYFF